MDSEQNSLGKTKFIFTLSGALLGTMVNTSRNVIKIPERAYCCGIRMIKRISGIKKRSRKSDTKAVINDRAIRNKTISLEKETFSEPIIDEILLEEIDPPSYKEELEEINNFTYIKEIEEIKETGTQGIIPLKAAKTPVLSASVTADEINDAVFNSAVEKVIFRRSIENLTNEDTEVRSKAIQSLGNIRHELTVKELAKYFPREKVDNLRKNCILSLDKLKLKTGLPTITAALKDKAASVRLAAVRALYSLAGKAAGPTLASMFHDNSADVRRRSASCVAWLSFKPSDSDLVLLFSDKDAAVRRVALDIVENIRSLHMVPKTIALLNDSDKSVQKKAYHVLQTITGKKMTLKFPESENMIRRLIARWEAWWDEESKTLNINM